MFHFEYFPFAIILFCLASTSFGSKCEGNLEGFEISEIRVSCVSPIFFGFLKKICLKIDGQCKCVDENNDNCNNSCFICPCQSSCIPVRPSECPCQVEKKPFVCPRPPSCQKPPCQNSNSPINAYAVPVQPSYPSSNQQPGYPNLPSGYPIPVPPFEYSTKFPVPPPVPTTTALFPSPSLPVRSVPILERKTPVVDMEIRDAALLRILKSIEKEQSIVRVSNSATSDGIFSSIFVAILALFSLI